ncbi:MAG: serine/threonine protein kinase, partial [Planctomycetaceae bacterium]|nr:serine/threonine protein kinase [Planctomycetaceae bacterium]
MAEEKDVQENKIGNYELLDVISGGTSCQIWEVSDGNQTWAMKTLLEEKLGESEERNALRHEGKILQMMTHPSFVAYRDMEIGKKASYIVMEYFRGPNLKSSLKINRHALHAQLERLLEQLCLGLGYMHEQGLVHRDIKPDNVLFSKSGELKIIDFSLTMKFKTGIAASISGKMKSIQGTRTYIAPETIQKKQPTPQTDMYSMGITLYEVLTGKTPFAGASPNDLLLKHLMDPPVPPSVHEPNVAPELDEFVLKLLAKKPKNRFSDMSEAYTELRSIKLFKEDPQTLTDRKKAEEEDKRNVSYEEVLDSRRDAERTAAGIKLPPKPKKKVPKVSPKKEEPKTPEPAAQQQPQQPMPQFPPGYQMPPPGYAPQSMPPGMMPYPMPPGGQPQWGGQQPMPPGYPQQMPPQPGAPYPGQQQPPPQQGGQPAPPAEQQ